MQLEQGEASDPDMHFEFVAHHPQPSIDEHDAQVLAAAQEGQHPLDTTFAGRQLVPMSGEKHVFDVVHQLQTLLAAHSPHDVNETQ